MFCVNSHSWISTLFLHRKHISCVLISHSGEFFCGALILLLKAVQNNFKFVKLFSLPQSSDSFSLPRYWKQFIKKKFMRQGIK